MSIEGDFEPHIAAQMQMELVRFSGKCHYDETIRKIVYHNDRYALEAYLSIQREEAERHKWIESEKHCCDLGSRAMTEWVSKFSEKFSRYWRHTHLYIPSPEVPENLQPHQEIGKAAGTVTPQES